jgi:hypothetical protein
MNKISDKILTGTLGELLVQMRLLQYGIQAAPPVKDSGNDLIAVNGNEFRAVSVRTTTTGTYRKPKVGRVYHVLAVVNLVGNDRKVYLDRSPLFLIPRHEAATASTDCRRLIKYKFSEQLVGRLFGSLAA